MIPRTLMLEMEAYVLASQRKIEICGLLAGKSNVAVSIYPITNSLQSAVRFNMEPMELLAALMEMEKNGWEIVATPKDQIIHQKRISMKPTSPISFTSSGVILAIHGSGKPIRLFHPIFKKHLSLSSGSKCADLIYSGFCDRII